MDKNRVRFVYTAIHTFRVELDSGVVVDEGFSSGDTELDMFEVWDGDDMTAWFPDEHPGEDAPKIDKAHELVAKAKTDDTVVKEPQSFEIVIRHPDFENEYETFGEPVECIEFDLGSSFDITKVGEEDLPQLVEWAAGYYKSSEMYPDEVAERVRDIALETVAESGAAGAYSHHDIHGMILVENGWEPSDIQTRGW